MLACAQFNSVKTEIAASVVLNYYRSLLEESNEMGIMNERHYHAAIEACDNAINCLSAHSHIETLPSYVDLLSSVGFLRFLTRQQLDSLFSDRRTGRKLFANVYVKYVKKKEEEKKRMSLYSLLFFFFFYRGEIISACFA